MQVPFSGLFRGQGRNDPSLSNPSRPRPTRCPAERTAATAGNPPIILDTEDLDGFPPLHRCQRQRHEKWVHETTQIDHDRLLAEATSANSPCSTGTPAASASPLGKPPRHLRELDAASARSQRHAASAARTRRSLRKHCPRRALGKARRSTSVSTTSKSWLSTMATKKYNLHRRTTATLPGNPAARVTFSKIAKSLDDKAVKVAEFEQKIQALEV
ncbi:hypothetical protein VTI74DRAFT_10798 [Chaetomium olivicolor]